MDDPDESKDEETPPQQIRLMQRMVDLSVQRTRLAEQRTRLAEQRTDMSAQRSDMSAQRSDMSEYRSGMSAERTYMAAERTLSVWVRTALALMVFGLAIDRFGLMLKQTPLAGQIAHAGSLSTFGGAALVAFGVLMAITTGLRFIAFARSYRTAHAVPHHHGPFLAPLFALLVALFGSALLFFLLVVSP